MTEILVISESERLAERLRASYGSENPDVIRNAEPGPEVASALASPKGRPRAVVVNLNDGEAAETLIESISQTYPTMLVAAAGERIPGERVLAAIRCGAKHYLEPPYDATALQTGLKGSDILDHSVSRKKGRLISFMSAQSGNGASMAAIHAACALVHERHANVLIADLDFHSGATAYRLRLNPRKTWADLSGGSEGRDRWRRALCNYRGVDILASPASTNVINLRGLPPVDAVLLAAAPSYDVVVADLPSALSASARAVAAQSDRIYLFCTPEPTSLHLAKRRLAELAEAGAPPSKVSVVLNRVAEHQILDEQDVKKVLGRPVELQIPNDYQAASTAEAEGRLASPGSMLARALSEVGWHISGARRPIQHEPMGNLSKLFRR